MTTIEDGRHVIIKRARESRLTFVKSGTCGSVGKLKFNFNDLIGRRFGLPYKIDRKQLVPCSTSELQLMEELEAIETGGADGADDIDEEMAAAAAGNGDSAAKDDAGSSSIEKKAKSDGGEIVTSTVGDSNRHKTAYAREKYLTKRAKKFSPIITVYPPSVRLVHEIYYSKDADKMAYLRQDCLAHLLTWSNVHRGCRVAIVEQCLGIVTAAVLDRMAGDGRCVRLHKGTQLQSIPAMLAMDLDEVTMAPLLAVPFDEFLGEGKSEEGGGDQMDNDDAGRRQRHGGDDQRMEEDGGEKKETKNGDGGDELRASRREQRAAQKAVGLQLLKDRKLDSFIIAGKEHPLEMMKRLLQCTAPSRPFVIYSSYMQPLLECYQWLREDGKSVNLRLLDNFYRKHQILPGRSHPEMNQPVASGYILTGITVAE